jgi:phosphate transport system substrate-binding protein
MGNRAIAVAAVGGLGLLAAGGAFAASSNNLIVGSTAIQPAFNTWCVHIGGSFCTDSGGGSGAGITAFKNDTADWEASDAPLAPTDITGHIKSNGYRYFVPAIWGVSVATNFAGEKTPIHLDGGTIASIFDGQITKWNAKQITALNPGVKFPNATIVECVRGDGSGTSYVFSNYLARVNGTFLKTVGPASKKPLWKGTITSYGTGNGLESACVNGTKNSIGYVELATAVGSNKYLALIGHKYKGKVYWTAPTSASVAAAASVAATEHGVSLKNPSAMQNGLLNTPSKSAYPIAATTFLLAYANYSGLTAHGGGAGQWAAVKKFINFAISAKGQKYLPGIHYAKLPAAWIKLDQAQELTVKP